MNKVGLRRQAMAQQNGPWLLCEAILAQGMSFIVVCKPESHATLYEWIKGLEAADGVKTVTVSRRKGKRFDAH
jgi:hypothetical protein